MIKLYINYVLDDKYKDNPNGAVRKTISKTPDVLVNYTSTQAARYGIAYTVETALVSLLLLQQGIWNHWFRHSIGYYMQIKSKCFILLLSRFLLK